MDCQSRYHPDNAGPETWLNLIGGVADAKTMGTIAFLQRWLRGQAPRPNLANLPVPRQSRASFNRKSVTGNITEIIQATLERSELRMRPGSVQKRSRNPERRRWRLCPREHGREWCSSAPARSRTNHRRSATVFKSVQTPFP